MAPKATARSVMRRLRSEANPTDAEHCLRFFKTGKGEYGEGDQFLGIRVPVIRGMAREYRDLERRHVLELLRDPHHEARMTALIILVHQYKRCGADTGRREIYRDYLDHIPHINGWDLVDCSAEHIVGAYLLERSRSPLHRLARSRSLWARRIAIMSTFHFIRRNDFDETLAIAERLLQDEKDLIHKAVGWMLREVGNRDHEIETSFLRRHYRGMPRTMLRYAIEKFPESERMAYLRGTA